MKIYLSPRMNTHLTRSEVNCFFIIRQLYEDLIVNSHQVLFHYNSQHESQWSPKDRSQHFQELIHRHQSLEMSSNRLDSYPMSKLQFEGEDEEELGKLAVRLANGIILPMALKSALELNLIEILAGAGDGAFLSPSEIAAHLPSRNPDAPVLLDRVLRLLASYSILKCSLRTLDNGEVERLYGVGPICKFLTRNPDGGSIGPLFLLHHDKVFMESWYYIISFVLFPYSGVSFP